MQCVSAKELDPTFFFLFLLLLLPLFLFLSFNKIQQQRHHRLLILLHIHFFFCLKMSRILILLWHSVHRGAGGGGLEVEGLESGAPHLLSASCPPAAGGPTGSSFSCVSSSLPAGDSAFLKGSDSCSAG